MSIEAHSWRKTSKQVGRRSLIGILISLSLTLVAFEWQGGEAPLKEPYWDPYEDENILAILPAVVIEKTTVPQKPKTSPRTSTPSISGTVEPVAVGPEPTEPTPAGPREEPEGPIGPSITDPGPATATMPAHWDLVSIRPHFVDCMKRGMEHVDECTEERIGRHLERRFRVPPGLKGPVRTTITFEIDVEGKVGKLICTPRVSPAIEAEIERVIRSLPQFIPGSQGGHTVPVYYQIPLSVRSASS